MNIYLLGPVVFTRGGRGWSCIFRVCQNKHLVKLRELIYIQLIQLIYLHIYLVYILLLIYSRQGNCITIRLHFKMHAQPFFFSLTFQGDCRSVVDSYEWFWNRHDGSECVDTTGFSCYIAVTLYNFSYI